MLLFPITFTNVIFISLYLRTEINREEEVEKCGECGRPGEWEICCFGCKEISYCSEKCEIAHWPKHLRECKDGNLRQGSVDFGLGLNDINSMGLMGVEHFYKPFSQY